nr:electron transfer flavoprotein subunit alpha/FixB family protein [Lactobacillus amylovorus]
TKAIRITPLQNSAVITVLFNGIMNNVEKAAVDIEHWQLATEDKNIYIKNEDSNNDLAYAKIVVAGGKGLQNAEGFQPLQELANKLNASLAATKAVTDQGWVDKNKMVGISNLTVKPDVYYAFGIAGAVQHTAGMDKSKHVIAVNTDRSAPIFKLAQYGIIGDANQVIDGLLNLL